MKNKNTKSSERLLVASVEQFKIQLGYESKKCISVVNFIFIPINLHPEPTVALGGSVMGVIETFFVADYYL